MRVCQERNFYLLIVTSRKRDRQQTRLTESWQKKLLLQSVHHGPILMQKDTNKISSKAIKWSKEQLILVVKKQIMERTQVRTMTLSKKE